MRLIPLKLEICITMNKIHSSSIFRKVFFTLEIKTRGLSVESKCCSAYPV